MLVVGKTLRRTDRRSWTVCSDDWYVKRRIW